MRFVRRDVSIFFCFVLAINGSGQQTVTAAAPRRDSQALGVLQQSLNAAGGMSAISSVQDLAGTGTITYQLTGAVIAASAQTAPTVKTVLRGSLLDCAQEKAIGVGGIDVYAYELPTAEGLYDELQKLETLRSAAGAGRAAEFFAAYDHFEKLVRSGKFRAHHSISNLQGTFAINHLSPGHDYLILAIGLKIEDETSYYNFKKVTLHPDNNNISMWMMPDVHCGPTTERLH